MLATDSMTVMQEQDLFFDFQTRRGSLPKGYQFTGLTQDSRKVTEGCIFIAIRGHQSDGHSHLDQAVAKGAQALVVEDDQNVPSTFSGFVFTVENTRLALEKLAIRFFQNPSSKLKMIGVTGTNGKTSVTYMLEHLLNCQNQPCGVIGTINHHFLDQVWDSQLTTPDPLSLQERLAQFLERGARFVAMEVSSHALDQKRVESIQFDGAIFTNLTRDHLDYHQDMDQYFSAKARLFQVLLKDSAKQSKFAVLNQDDSWIQKLQMPSSISTWPLSSQPTKQNSYQILNRSFGQTQFTLKIGGESHEFTLPMPGEHNVQNMTSALCAMKALGFQLEQLKQAVASFPGVPGRLQKVPCQSSRAVFVDYAHSPDALENVLRTLIAVRTQTKTQAQIKVLFGCGGDRDKGKRPLMAKVAESLADQIYLTSDNPRTEDPQQILKEILAGFQSEKRSDVHIEVDRKKAIESALSDLAEGDVLLIAGKGHEDYQIIGDQKKPFSDYQISLNWLKEKGL